MPANDRTDAARAALPVLVLPCVVPDGQRQRLGAGLPGLMPPVRPDLTEPVTMPDAARLTLQARCPVALASGWVLTRLDRCHQCGPP